MASHRILIIEDQVDLADSLRSVLRSSLPNSISIYVSNSVLEAINIFKTYSISFIICDLGLDTNAEDGITLYNDYNDPKTDFGKRSPEDLDPYWVFMSGNVEGALHVKSIQNSIFMPKPLNVKDLVEKIKSVLNILELKDSIETFQAYQEKLSATTNSLVDTVTSLQINVKSVLTNQDSLAFSLEEMRQNLILIKDDLDSIKVDKLKEPKNSASEPSWELFGKWVKFFIDSGIASFLNFFFKGTLRYVVLLILTIVIAVVEKNNIYSGVVKIIGSLR